MVTTDNSAKMVRLLVKVISRVGVLAWISVLCLHLYYGFSRPTSRQPDAGRLYRLDTHGRVAYLTHREITNLHFLWGASIGLILVASTMALVVKMRERRNAQNRLSQ